MPAPCFYIQEKKEGCRDKTSRQGEVGIRLRELQEEFRDEDRKIYGKDGKTSAESQLPRKGVKGGKPHQGEGDLRQRAGVQVARECHVEECHDAGSVGEAMDAGNRRPCGIAPHPLPCERARLHPSHWLNKMIINRIGEARPKFQPKDDKKNDEQSQRGEEEKIGARRTPECVKREWRKF